MLNSKAYTEVYYIINQMSEELKSKIPEKFIKNIESKMDKDYDFYMEDDDYENTELLEDTEKILSVIYTDYLATEEEREVILNKEKILAKRNKIILPEIQVNDIFLKQNNDNKLKENKLIEKNEEKWYLKVLKFIKNLFIH